MPDWGTIPTITEYGVSLRWRGPHNQKASDAFGPFINELDSLELRNLVDKTNRLSNAQVVQGVSREELGISDKNLTLFDETYTSLSTYMLFVYQDDIGNSASFKVRAPDASWILASTMPDYDHADVIALIAEHEHILNEVWIIGDATYALVRTQLVDGRIRFPAFSAQNISLAEPGASGVPSQLPDPSA